jgi:hypothetical protein
MLVETIPVEIQLLLLVAVVVLEVLVELESKTILDTVVDRTVVMVVLVNQTPCT